MAPRSKPRVNHVRTGCLTCKRRRVKCPEERPHCSRCIRGGFTCAGYVIPKAWIFQSSVEAQAKSRADPAWPGASKNHQNTLLDPGSLVTQSKLSIKRLLFSPVHSPLQLGNSDPFSVYAIPIGPRESHDLEIYNKLVVPRMYSSGMLSIGDMGTFFSDCLKDEAAGYALFARNSAVESFALRGPYTTPSASFLGYMTRSCAVLRNRLSLMNGSETAQGLLPIMWATCLLAVAEMFTGFSTAEVHMRAMSKLIVRYIELVDRKPETKPILVMAFIDVARASVTLSHSMIDVYGLFPQLFQTFWDSMEGSNPNAQAKKLQLSAVHADVEDKLLKEVIIRQREKYHWRHHTSQERELDPERAKAHWTAVFSQTIFQHSQLLHTILDALEKLKNPHLQPEQIQRRSVRAYLSASLLLWLQMASTAPFTNNKVFDMTSTMLNHIKGMMKKDILVRDSSQDHAQAYADARLWTLFLVIHYQIHKRQTSVTDWTDDEWFVQTFRSEAEARQILSWQQAILIFKQFLYDEQIEPHISQWWYQVVPEQSFAATGQVKHMNSWLLESRPEVVDKPGHEISRVPA